MIENAKMFAVFKIWDGPSRKYIIHPRQPQKSLDHPVPFGEITFRLGNPGHADLGGSSAKSLIFERPQGKPILNEMTLVLQRKPQPGQNASVGREEKHRLGVDDLRETRQFAIGDLQFVDLLQIYNGVPSQDSHPPMIEIVSSSSVGEGGGMLH
ncbi:hypothetical protein HY409_04065 [Candidatus Gottesmanbacteria bacterium]|nr:hypothetical protein [Candidatus Gottesmanbacteria bacterium]